MVTNNTMLKSLRAPNPEKPPCHFVHAVEPKQKDTINEEKLRSTQLPTDTAFTSLAKSRIIGGWCGYCPESGKIYAPQKICLERIFSHCGVEDLYPSTELQELEAKVPSNFGNIFVDATGQPLFDKFDGTQVGISMGKVESLSGELRQQLLKIKTKEIIEKVLETHQVKKVTDEYLQSVLKVGGPHKGLFKGFPEEFGFPRFHFEQVHYRNPCIPPMHGLVSFDYPTDARVYIGIKYYYPNAEFGIPTPTHYHGN